MKALPDGCVDAVITDPPYGMSYLSNRYKAGNPHGVIEGDMRYPKAAFGPMFRVSSGYCIAFGRWENIPDVPMPHSVIVWAKNNWSAGDLYHEYARQWEAIFFWAFDGHSFADGRPQDIIDYRRIPADSLNHPTEKPVGLLETLMLQNGGASILDPFLGSGTTAVAAKKLGRHFLGFEISEDYCRIARERIALVEAQPSLFEPQATQASLFA